VELTESEIFLVEPETLRFTLPFTGTLHPLEQTTVKAEVAAPVGEVMVREGEAVKRGDVLLRIDVADRQSALAERTANLEGAKAQLDLARKNREAKQKLASKGYAARQTVNEVEAAFDAAESTVRALEAQVATARKALAKAEVTAPIDGIVAERGVNPGDKVSVDTTLMTLVSLREMEIDAPVPASEIGQVAVGQAAEFRVPGVDDETFRGTVSRINPVARSGTRSIPVHIQVENPEGALRGGMFASGEIVTREEADILAVPPAAIRRDGNGAHVLKLEDGRIRRQSVIPGSRGTHERVPVPDGLSPGDRIVSAPAIVLAPGTPVRVSGP
jgi:RND family efflux transporter MFP subunit